MKDKNLKSLFDYQKFEGNSAMNFAIQSARDYIDSLSNTVMELSEDELEMVSAAGIPSLGTIKPLEPKTPLF